MSVPLVTFAQDRRLGAATLIWRDRQLEWLAAFGDDAIRIVVGSAGRQGGKSSCSCVAGLWNASSRPDLDELVPRGRVRSVLLVSASDDQARELLRIAAAMVEASPVLRELATIQTGVIRFTLPSGAVTELRSLANNPGTVRGRTASMVIGDEFAHINSDATGWNSDERMLEALEGSMSLFDGAGLSKLVLVSTPNGEQGAFHRLFKAASEGSLPDSIALSATAWELNPALDSDKWRESKIRLLGQSGFDQEHGAQFVTGGGQFFDMRELAFELEQPAAPEQCDSWIVGLDVAYHADRCGVAIVGTARQDPRLFLVGGLWAIEPSGIARSQRERRAREDRTLEKVWELIQRFRPHNIVKIVSDQHDSVAVQSFFGDRGIEVEIVAITAPRMSEQMVMVRSRLTNGSLRCFPDPQLLEDLRRVRARRGSEAVVLPHYAGGHCDELAALGQAVYSLGGEYTEAAYGAISLPSGGWSDGQNGDGSTDPQPGSAEYARLTTEEQYQICMRRSGLGVGGAGFLIPGQTGHEYDSPGAAWISGPGEQNDW
jgi:hypothetical protein